MTGVVCSTPSCERPAHARLKCRSCYDKWLKSINPEYKSKQAHNKNQWVKANRERNNETAQRRVRARDPRKNRDAMLRSKYGISVDDYDAMLAAQNGACAVCLGLPVEGRVLHVDHCHITKKVRGLLCCHCNWYLGRIDKDPEILNRIVEYRK